MPLHPLDCVDRDGVRRRFFVRLDERPAPFTRLPAFPGMPSGDDSTPAWDVEVYAAPEPSSADEHASWELVRDPRLGGALRSQSMSNNEHASVSGKRVFDALIPWMANHLAEPIYSSSGHAGDATETRTEAATRIWRRLVEGGVASFDATADRFVCRPAGEQ